MSKPIKHIAVIGDGGWGTTLAVHLSQKHYDVSLWGPFPDYVHEMYRRRENIKFLPGIHLPNELCLCDDLREVLTRADLIVWAVPSKYTPAVLKRVKATRVPLTGKRLVSVTKGIDTRTLKRMSELLTAAIPNVPLAVLSGPNISTEVARGIPSTAVIASRKTTLAKELQEVFNSDRFRIYTNTDVIGVELGGSIKNIIAIACGVCDGLGFGTNTKSAILTRGLAEISRLGKILGAKEKTFTGLSGLGDLATTCFSPQSRNRTVGEHLGQGQSIEEITHATEMVAEGVETVKAAYTLSIRHHIPMPITTEVYNIIYKHKKPQQAVADLMTRKTKAE